MQNAKVPVYLIVALVAQGCGVVVLSETQGDDVWQPTAAAPAEAEVEAETAPPVLLHPLSATPDCWTEPSYERVTDSAMSWERMVMQRQIAAMQASFDLQSAEAILLRPVREDPTALEWHFEEGDYLVEGFSVVRGRGWGALSLAATLLDAYGRQRDDWYVGAEVSYSPLSTSLDLGSPSYTVGRHFVRSDKLLRGCDPDTGWSFEVGPGLDGPAGEQPLLLCWNPRLPPAPDAAAGESETAAPEGAVSGGVDVAAPFVPGGAVVSATSDENGQIDWSQQSACLQALHGLLSTRQQPLELWGIPVIILR